MSVDISQLKEFKRRLEEAKDGGASECVEECCRGLVSNLLKHTIRNTPVDTGYLRRGWTGGQDVGNNMSKIEEYVKTMPIQKTSLRMTIKVSNPIEYAPYVEHGHVQQPGRYVPKLGKRLKADWVEGRHMLRDSESLIREGAEAFVERKVQKYLKGVIKP